ncbi:MAG: beta-lactamase family protein, partial [Anaerolineae bacterium]|nr:beta-lactamase family protein [Anaerolineae bacterium]
MAESVFPGATWERTTPFEAGMDQDKLEAAHRWMAERMGDKPYRIVIVRRGRVVAEWNGNIGPEPKLPIASAAKSVYSNVLGILVNEGDRIATADAPVYDFYPEFMDVPEGTGPKEARYAYPKDRTITFRQLICNTSGYMKPGEEPGTVFNYQTFGMNVLTHALAAAYGLYDVRDPEGSPGFKVLIEEKLARKIGVQWEYTYNNFKLAPEARIQIYGYYTAILTNAPDFARLGWLWCNWGRWGEEQVIPEAWLRASVDVNPDLRAHCPR